MVLLILSVFEVQAQTLYTRTFGSIVAPAIIYLHGGPGYNSANFEVTTAQRLADLGFYVIVYDRRGEGRSADPNAKFHFEESFDDLLTLYRQYGFQKATLLGHSFGGVVATLFAEKYPEKIRSVILVGAPVSLQETFQTILTTLGEIYSSRQDSVNLRYLEMLENMDRTTLEFSSYCFMHAMQNKFYSPQKLSEEAARLYNDLSMDTILFPYVTQMTYPAPRGFWENERYTSIDLTETLQRLSALGIAVHGLYGKEDGLYAADQIEELRRVIGEDRVRYLDQCSHNVFIDQQKLFLEAVINWAD